MEQNKVAGILPLVRGLSWTVICPVRRHSTSVSSCLYQRTSGFLVICALTLSWTTVLCSVLWCRKSKLRISQCSSQVENQTEMFWWVQHTSGRCTVLGEHSNTTVADDGFVPFLQLSLHIPVRIGQKALQNTCAKEIANTNY